MEYWFTTVVHETGSKCAGMQGNVSDMDRQRTLVDVIRQLHGCLDDLDKLGSVVAAAHLSACLDALASDEMADAHLSNLE